MGGIFSSPSPPQRAAPIPPPPPPPPPPAPTLSAVDERGAEQARKRKIAAGRNVSGRGTTLLSDIASQDKLGA